MAIGGVISKRFNNCVKPVNAIFPFPAGPGCALSTLESRSPSDMAVMIERKNLNAR
jgi:hypothetical protein